MKNRALGLFAILLSAGETAYSVECRSQGFDELTRILSVHFHTYLAATENVDTVEKALRDSLMVLDKNPLAQSSALIGPIHSLSLGALRYVDSVCFPYTTAENNDIATLFVGLVAAIENTDTLTILSHPEDNELTEREKILRKAAVMAARQAVGAIIGGAVGKLVRGGPIGSAVGVFLTPSETTRQQDLQAPPDRDLFERPGNERGSFLGDVDPGILERIGTLAQVEFSTALAFMGPVSDEKRGENTRRIAAAQAIVANSGR